MVELDLETGWARRPSPNVDPVAALIVALGARAAWEAATEEDRYCAIHDMFDCVWCTGFFPEVGP